MLAWSQQPPPAVPLDWSSPLVRGMDFCFAGDLLRDYASGAKTTRVGTVPTAPPPGFPAFGGASGRGFDTAGVGTTDVVNTAYTADRLQRSYLALVRPKSAGGGGLGRVFDKSSNSTYNDTLGTNAPSWSYGRIFSGGSSSWAVAPLTLNQTALLVMTYDASLSTNDPIAYLDGIKQTVTNLGRGTGTVSANTAPLWIGNRPVDSARVFDGWIGLVIGWRRILAASEIVALSENPWKVFAPLAERRAYSLPSGGNVYNVSLAESASASDSASASGTFAVSISEAGSASDAETTSGAAYAVSVSEAANALDTISVLAIYAASLTESGSAADAVGIADYTIDPRYLIRRAWNRTFSVRRAVARSFEVNWMTLRFDAKAPTEAVPLTFDFSADLQSGETLSGTVTVSYSVMDGTDSNPSSLSNGVAAFDLTNTKVVQPVRGGVDGVTYKVTVTTTTSNADKVLTLSGILPVTSL